MNEPLQFPLTLDFIGLGHVLEGFVFIIRDNTSVLHNFHSKFGALAKVHRFQNSLHKFS